VCLPVCICIEFKLLYFWSLFLLQAAHVANKVVYIKLHGSDGYSLGLLDRGAGWARIILIAEHKGIFS